MAFPPATLPTTRANDVPQIDDHPANHNNVNAAVNDIVAEMMRPAQTAQTAPALPGQAPTGLFVTHPGPFTYTNFGTPLVNTSGAFLYDGLYSIDYYAVCQTDAIAQVTLRVTIAGVQYLYSTNTNNDGFPAWVSRASETVYVRAGQTMTTQFAFQCAAGHVLSIQTGVIVNLVRRVSYVGVTGMQVEAELEAPAPGVGPWEYETF